MLALDYLDGAYLVTGVVGFSLALFFLLASISFYKGYKRGSLRGYVCVYPITGFLFTVMITLMFLVKNRQAFEAVQSLL